MKDHGLPNWNLRESYRVIVCYLRLTDVIKDRKRKKLSFSSSRFLFRFSSLPKHIFEAVQTMNAIK